mgnify:CR=1 FL=1
MKRQPQLQATWLTVQLARLLRLLARLLRLLARLLRLLVLCGGPLVLGEGLLRWCVAPM